MTCAKQTTRCRIVTVDGEEFIGENFCLNPQQSCPRVEGEGYDKCLSICNQVGHAEQVAVKLAGYKAKGAVAYLSGHTYFCMECQHALFEAGVTLIGLEKL